MVEKEKDTVIGDISIAWEQSRMIENINIHPDDLAMADAYGYKCLSNSRSEFLHFARGYRAALKELEVAK